MKTRLGIIGGSGIYDLPDLKNKRELDISSPWGPPSSPLMTGQIGEIEIIFLARHGRLHQIPPSEINYRANMDCLKRAGVTDLVSLCACGSFHEHYPPQSCLVIDQFLDFTRQRSLSFFGTGCVAHVSMAHPVSPLLSRRLFEAGQKAHAKITMGGTYLAIEGPQFSTRAESHFYKGCGADVIGMTGLPEAKLAREAEISFAMLAMVTDYDCWHPEHGLVDAQMVLNVMHANSEMACRIVSILAQDLPSEHENCPIGSDRALDHALATHPDNRDPVLMRKLEALTRRVLDDGLK